MKVKRNTLLLIACLVWSTAGVNILHIGMTAYPAYRSLLNYLLSVLVFAVFQKFVFGKLVKKHTARINGYLEEPAVLLLGQVDLRQSGLSQFSILVWALPFWRPVYCLAVTMAEPCLPPQLKIEHRE